MIEKIPIRYIIELGLIRKRGVCAKCEKVMDVLKYHIQLCRKCRIEELDKFTQDNTNENHSHLAGSQLNEAKREVKQGGIQLKPDNASPDDTNDLCSCGHERKYHEGNNPEGLCMYGGLRGCNCKKFVKQNKGVEDAN